MRIFLAVTQPVLADQIKVGLAAFGGVQIDQEHGILALEKVRRLDVDALILDLDPNAPEQQELLDKARDEVPGLDVIVICHEAIAVKLREEKVRGRIFALLKDPLIPVDFFRTISRLRQKRATVHSR